MNNEAAENNDNNPKTRVNLDESGCPSSTENIILLTMALVAVKRLSDVIADPYEYLKEKINYIATSGEMVLGIAAPDGGMPLLTDDFMAFVQMRTVVHLTLMICLGSHDAGRGDLTPVEYQKHLRAVSGFLCQSEAYFNDFLARCVDAKALLARLISSIELTAIERSEGGRDGVSRREDVNNN